MKKEDFIWWGTDPKDGELTLVIDPKSNFKFGRIICPGIMRERLMRHDGSSADKVIALELMLGPVGLIDGKHYEEASIDLIMPLQVRAIAIRECYRAPINEDGDKPALSDKEDKILSDFITHEWQRARSGKV